MAAIIKWNGRTILQMQSRKVKKKKKKLSCPDSIESIHQETCDKAVAGFIC